MKVWQILAEDLGNLSQLGVGDLINVLKQQNYRGRQTRRNSYGGGETSDEKKFSSSSVGERFGSDSEIIDVGVLKNGIASLRKAYRANETEGDWSTRGAPIAFALYIGKQAVALEDMGLTI